MSSITRQHVHLDDGTVWVTSLKNRKAARFNVKLKEPDSAVASSAARFDIVQHDSDTVLTEGAKAPASPPPRWVPPAGRRPRETRPR